MAALPTSIRPAVSPQTRPVTTRRIRVHSARDLAQALTHQAETPRLEVLVCQDIRLGAEDSGGGVPGLLVGKKGHELIIRPEFTNQQPTIQWAYDASKTADTWAALTVEGGKVKIERLRFEIDAKEQRGFR